jgi:hypothetical protein
MPRSIVISESGTVADGGHSWTVPVFVLDSNPNDVRTGDEDLIPPNGNPHPRIHQQMDVDHQEHFEDVGDLQEVQQANLDQGWQIPSPPHPAQNDGWDEWPQQEGELVGDNELNLVNNLANQVVVNAVENGLMQHPEMSQDSSSVSSEATAFFSKLKEFLSLLNFLSPLMGKSQELLICLSYLALSLTVIFPSDNWQIDLGYILDLAQVHQLRC